MHVQYNMCATFTSFAITVFTLHILVNHIDAIARAVNKVSEAGYELDVYLVHYSRINKGAVDYLGKVLSKAVEQVPIETRADSRPPIKLPFPKK